MVERLPAVHVGRGVEVRCGVGASEVLTTDGPVAPSPRRGTSVGHELTADGVLVAIGSLPDTPVEDLAVADWDREHAVNPRGPILLSRRGGSDRCGRRGAAGASSTRSARVA